MNTGQRMHDLLEANWTSISSETRIALTVLANEIDDRDKQSAEFRNEVASLRKAVYWLAGIIVSAAIANGLLTAFT